MREIKFRAWDGKYMLDSSYGDWVSFDGVAWTTPARGYNTPHTEIEKAKNYVLMQYTGLKDCKGKDIYESDIVKQDTIVGEVKYFRYGFFIEFTQNDKARITLGSPHPQDQDKPAKCEVIGNIYENPELL